MIVEHVWDMDYDGLSNIVDVYIRHLRSKIDDKFPVKMIHTVRGIGYMLDAPEKAERSAEQQVEHRDLPVIEQRPVGFDGRAGAVDDLAKDQERRVARQVERDDVHPEWRRTVYRRSMKPS